MSKLFISHAAHDKVLVEAFVDLLEAGVGIPHQSIFCSSLKGQSIKPGKDFVESIRQSLDGAACVLALISEAYYVSAFCMCELGGVWLQNKSFLPVIVPPVDYSQLKAVLGKLQASKIGAADDLDELRDELIERLSIEGHKTPRWNTKRDAFLGCLKPTLKEIEFTGPVSHEKFEKLKGEFDTYREEYKARQVEIESLNGLVSDLKKAKDAKSVTKIVRKHSSAMEEFGALASDAASALQPLPRVVCEALYYRARGENYFPERDDSDEIQLHVEYGLLEQHERCVTPRKKNPKVANAIEALDGLSRWLDSPPEEFFECYEQETGSETPDITLRPFWERHLE